MTFANVTDRLKDGKAWGMILGGAVAALIVWALGMQLAAQYPGKKWAAYVPAIVGIVAGLAFVKSKEGASLGYAVAAGSAAGGLMVAAQTNAWGARLAGGGK